MCWGTLALFCPTVYTCNGIQTTQGIPRVNETQTLSSWSSYFGGVIKQLTIQISYEQEVEGIQRINEGELM